MPQLPKQRKSGSSCQDGIAQHGAHSPSDDRFVRYVELGALRPSDEIGS